MAHEGTSKRSPPFEPSIHYPNNIPMGHGSNTKPLREKFSCVLSEHRFETGLKGSLERESCSRRFTYLDPVGLESRDAIRIG